VTVSLFQLDISHPPAIPPPLKIFSGHLLQRIAMRAHTLQVE